MAEPSSATPQSTAQEGGGPGEGESMQAPVEESAEAATGLEKVDVWASDAGKAHPYETLGKFKDELVAEAMLESGKAQPFYKCMARQLSMFAADVAAAFYVYALHTINFEGFMVVGNAVAVTSFYVYYLNDDDVYLASKLDFSILSFAVVFPLTFLMQQAFARRELALANLADFKALVCNVTMATLFWDFPDPETKEFNGRSKLPASFYDEVQASNHELLHIVYQFLALPGVSRARNYVIPKHRLHNDHVHVLQDKLAQRFAAVMRRLYNTVEVLKFNGMPGNESSRINQYHWFIQQRFERMRVFKHYRTPQATRSFGRVYILLLPWFFGPYFAWVAGLQETSDGALTPQTNRAFALCLSGFTFLVLLGLINSGRLMEDPFQEGSGFDCAHLKHEIASVCQAVAYYCQQARRRPCGRTEPAQSQ